ncbi:tail fiber domain-containing protein [Stenotrophomonas hibiscicola]|uniref:tail fiber domain-containing protein n=1 Tax=Stenotrophomonas hibiscicola TaxID=86189 RepID=UPI002E76E31A|nr:tail fiber domain-containing protein [[Pseudomonas] hibiscicola]
MAQQVIDIDTVQPNGKKGDPARTMAQKINTNFAALMGNTKANFAWFGPASGSDAPAGFRAMVAADLPSALRAAAQSGAQSLFWATPATASGVPTLRGLVASDIPSLSATYATLSSDQVLSGKKVFGASSTSADRVEVSSAGVVGYGSGTGSVAYGFTFDSRLPSVAAQIFARFQVMDISGSATVARIVAANYQGNQGEYRFAHTGTATAVLWQSTSDERIKDDFVQIENALDKLMQITGYASFSKKANIYDPGQPQRVTMAGVKAQDVQRVLPAATSSAGSGFDNDGNPINDILGVDALGVCALIIEAIRDLNAKVDALRGVEA